MLATTTLLLALTTLPTYGGPGPDQPDPIEPGTVSVRIYDDDPDRAHEVCDWVADRYGAPYACSFEDQADTPDQLTAPAWVWVIPPAPGR